jgi:hypothetical protein
LSQTFLPFFYSFIWQCIRAIARSIRIYTNNPGCREFTPTQAKSAWTKRVKIFIPKNITPRNPVSVGPVPRYLALTGF